MLDVKPVPRWLRAANRAALVYRHGWLRVVDDLAEVDLDQLSARLTAAEGGEEAPAGTAGLGEGPAGSSRA